MTNVTTRARGVTKCAGVQCHKMRRGYFRLGVVQGVLRPLAPEKRKDVPRARSWCVCKRKDVPKARSWCVCKSNAHWLGRAHPRRHAEDGWKIRKGNFSFPVTALRTKSSYCTVTRQCACVNKIHSATRTNLVWNFPERNIERHKYLRLLDSPFVLWLDYVCTSNYDAAGFQHFGIRDNLLGKSKHAFL